LIAASRYVAPRTSSTSVKDMRVRNQPNVFQIANESAR
jgi:hypothetical protein